jgi:probable DNA metabolism protein
MKQIAMKVGKEGEYVRQFIRFQKLADGSYFAPVAPKYNALPLAIDYLQDRFAGQLWLVYDTKRRYGYYHDLKKTIEVLLEDDEHLIGGKLDEHLMDSNEKLFQELWKNYFKSLAIKERINPKLQRRNMPARFWKYLTEKSE